MNLVNAPNVIYASNNNVCGPGHNVACNSDNDPYTNGNVGIMVYQRRICATRLDWPTTMSAMCWEQTAEVLLKLALFAK